MDKVFVMDHPLILHKMSIIRNKETGSKEFRELVKEISVLLAYEVTRTLQLKDIEIETPICTMKTKALSGRKQAIIPILRAGLGMVDGFLELLPAAKVGHVGLYRDPDTLEPVEYYCKLPQDIDKRDVYVVDPMLATGGSAIAAITFLKNKGVKDIKFVCLIGCPEGLKALTDAHPDVQVYVASVDEKLNDHAYIVPGLGDAGDRLFGTK